MQHSATAVICRSGSAEDFLDEQMECMSIRQDLHVAESPPLGDDDAKPDESFMDSRCFCRVMRG